MNELSQVENAPTKAPLREGFTTGTAAAAAALAAASLLLAPLEGIHAPGKAMRTPLPPFGPDGTPAAYLDVPIAACRRLDARSARAEVVKDGGDDPDATHGMVIAATVCLCAGARPGEVILAAGPGIGQVTLPG